MSAAPMRLLPAAPPAPKSRALDKLHDAIAAMERRGRRSTRKMARKALAELAQVVALIGLHLPASTPRQLRYERDAINPILEAIDRATGHCPRCGIRVASWAAPIGRSGFYPCASHKNGGPV